MQEARPAQPISYRLSSAVLNKFLCVCMCMQVSIVLYNDAVVNDYGINSVEGRWRWYWSATKVILVALNKFDVTQDNNNNNKCCCNISVYRVHARWNIFIRTKEDTSIPKWFDCPYIDYPEISGFSIILVDFVIYIVSNNFNTIVRDLD